jgi:hypothetical protein
MKLKKMMMLMVAVMAVVGAASASNVKWGISSGALNGTDFAAGSTLYLVWDNNGGGMTYDGALATQTSYAIGNVTDSQEGSGSLVAGAYYNALGQSIVPADVGGTAGSKPFYLVAISADGKTIAYTATKPLNIQASALSQTANWLNTDFTVVHAIPEPTSLALLAFGAAAIGLRRKFRK